MVNYEEQRNHQRFPIRTKVRVWLNQDSVIETVTLDFSDGGLFILADSLANLASETILRVQSAEAMEEAPILDARVAWSNKKGCGIEYLLADKATANQ